LALYIHSNVASLTAQSSLSRATLQVRQSYQRLSSGLRVNSAADDAAVIGISDNLRAQSRSFAIAERNANAGISMVNAAEGGLGEIGNMLIRMRELALQASNGELTSSDRANIDIEYQQLLEEISRVAAATQFNGTALLDATKSVTFQVGIGTSGTDHISVSFGINEPTDDGDEVSSGETKMVKTGDGESSGGSTTDWDVALNATNVSSQPAAQDAIAKVDTAIGAVSNRRASLGAAGNRLRVAISNIRAMHINLERADSRIRDVDVAQETSKLTRGRTLQQAGTAILAQANMAPTVVLMLLNDSAPGVGLASAGSYRMWSASQPLLQLSAS